MTQTTTFLVLVPEEIKEISGAMRYAALSAQKAGGNVALLAVVEPEDIGAWGGVDKVITDDAFERARQVVAHFSSFVKEVSGSDPLPLYMKGRKREVLVDVIKNEPGISAIVLTANAKENGQNSLIQYLTGQKGIQKLAIPLIIVPDSFYKEEEGKEEGAAEEGKEDDKSPTPKEDSGNEK